MDYDIPALSETMNATFLSKVSIVASYVEKERLENNIVLSYESKTEGYTTESETIEITATSENYNLIEISDDGNTFTSISPTKEIKVTREYTEEGIKKFYVRDEVGNIKEIVIELNHLDQSGPEIVATPQEEWGASNTISIELEDLKSGLSGYQITATEEEPTEWKEASGSSLTIEEVVTENRDYYIWSKDALGNINHQKVTISKIDNVAPTSRFTTSITGGSVSIDAGESTDEETGIVKYEYKLDNGSYYPSETSKYTFTGVSHGTHTITVRVTDAAGNQHETTQNVNVVILFTISYNANGGSGALASQTKIYGVNLTLSSTKPTRTGYTFLGWSTSSTATSATYSAGGTFTSNANTTLYAVWRVNTYTITYNANGGSGAPAAQSYTYATSGTVNLSATRPTRTGYTFLGWSQSSTATSASYSAGQAWNRSNASNYTLYAVWKINTYTVSYNANGGSGAPAAQTKTYGRNLTLSSTKPTRSGYTFLGWSTSSSATSATYSSGGTFTSNANTTLYAVWLVNTLYLYDNGNEYTANTNGWSTRVFQSYGGSDYVSYTLRKDSTSLYMYTIYNHSIVEGSAWRVGYITNKAVDVTHYNRMYVYLWFNTPFNAAAYLTVRNSSNQVLASTLIGNGTSNNGYGTYSVNLSGVTGNVYATVEAYSSYTTGTVGETRVYRVWYSV